MKLEVGMYVRTKNEIVQIDKILNGVMEDTKGHLHFGDFIKTSHNIIDLIEVGDYVNGIEVLHLIDKQIPKLLLTDNGCISNGDIKSIVTKEQFESMSYKVDND